MFNFAAENKTTTAARPVPRKLKFYIMTKEKFAFAFDHASFCIFGALICGLLSLLPLQYIGGADDRRLFCCWFFFILFACGALELFIGVIITFRRGLKYYDEEQAAEEARARYYASRAPRRVRTATTRKASPVFWNSSRAEQLAPHTSAAGWIAKPAIITMMQQ